MTKKITSILALSLLLIVPACKRGGDNNPLPSAGSLQDAQGNALELDVASLPVNQLSSHPNAIISNNVSRAISYLQNNDLAEGMVSLTAIASLPGELDPAQLTAVTSSIQQVADVASAAAEAGNENAQYAMEVLNIFTSSQR